jgi:outer membrane murein-binding lipoprotein Lpp
MSRLDILESDVKALRNFIGLSGILSLGNDKIDTADKIKVAINGEFFFSQADGKYFVNDGGYAIGEEDALTSSFIDSFFNLMKRVDSVENINNTQSASIESINEELSKKAESATVESLRSEVNTFNATVESIRNSVSGANDRVDTLTGRVTELQTNVGQASSGLEDLNEKLDAAKTAINNFAPNVTSTLIVKKAQDILKDFTVTGNQNFVISPPTNKTYYCKVLFIIDPKCEYIGLNTTNNTGVNNRMNNINSAIKDTDPYIKYNYDELPRWKDTTDANNDTNAYVVYNKSFSNIDLLGLSMEGSINSNKGIYCGITKDNDKIENKKIGCLPKINRVGCIMSDLVIYDKNSGTGTQYAPFYFELKYKPFSTSGIWNFSWEVENNTENT